MLVLYCFCVATEFSVNKDLYITLNYAVYESSRSMEHWRCEKRPAVLFARSAPAQCHRVVVRMRAAGDAGTWRPRDAVYDRAASPCIFYFNPALNIGRVGRPSQLSSRRAAAGVIASHGSARSHDQKRGILRPGGIMTDQPPHAAATKLQRPGQEKQKR